MPVWHSPGSRQARFWLVGVEALSAVCVWAMNALCVRQHLPSSQVLIPNFSPLCIQHLAG